MQHQKRTCGYCAQEYSWLFSGKKLKDGTKVYMDDKGAKWAGKRCPICEKSRVKNCLKFSEFDRNLVISQLEKQGYQVLSTAHPLKVEKDGQTFRLSLRKASVDGDKIQFEQPKDEEADLYALLFESVKIVNEKTFSKLQN